MDFKYCVDQNTLEIIKLKLKLNSNNLFETKEEAFVCVKKTRAEIEEKGGSTKAFKQYTVLDSFEVRALKEGEVVPRYVFKTEEEAIAFAKSIKEELDADLAKEQKEELKEKLRKEILREISCDYELIRL